MNADLSRIEMKDVIKLDGELFKLELKKDDIEASLDEMNLQNQLYYSDNQPINWEDFNFVLIENVAQLVKTELSSDPFGEVLLASRRLALDKERLVLETAESRSNFGYIQAEYDTDRGDIFNDHFGYQLGINLPIFNTDKPKLQREKLEVIESEFDLKQIERDNNVIDQIRLLQFNALHERLEKLREKIEKFAQMEGNGVEEIASYIALSNYLVSLSEMENETLFKLMGIYIDILEQKGKLANAPYVNYLSAEFSIFSIE
jgi:hypothetical protein